MLWLVGAAVVSVAALAVAYPVVWHRPSAAGATTSLVRAAGDAPGFGDAGASRMSASGLGRAASPVASATRGVPAPFVQSFAQQPGRPRATPHASPTGTVSVPPNIDGCDHDYGGIGVCVPWTFPAGVTDRCGWLRARGFGPVAVKGTDRLDLDTNRDGIACDTGDRPVR